MAVYDMQVPEFNTIDALAEAREQRDQRTRARMNKKAYLDEILAVLREQMDDPRTGLGEVVDRLFDAPIRDAYDRQAYLHLHDGHRLGAQVLGLIADISLTHYQDADVEGF